MRRQHADPESESVRQQNGQTESQHQQTSAADRSGSISRLHGAIGNQSLQSSIGVTTDGIDGPGRRTGTTGVHHPAGLTVNDPNSRREREAERVAERVADPSASVTVRETANTRVQRLCSRCQKRVRTGKPLNCPECERTLQRQTATGATQSEGKKGSVSHSLDALGSGRQLAPDVKSVFESRFGRDFGDVRVHTGPDADAAARSVDARAFTHGRDIVFRRGEYRPGTSGGDRLLAHELAHVVQQDAIGSQFLQRSAMSSTRKPRSLTQSVDPSQLTDRELANEIRAIRRWLRDRSASSPRAHRLRETLSRLEAELRRRDDERADTGSSGAEKPEAQKSSTGGGMTSADAPASVPAQESEPKMSVPKDSAVTEVGKPREAGQNTGRGAGGSTRRKQSGEIRWWNCIKGAAVGAASGVWGFIKAIGGSVLNPISAIKNAYNGIYNLIQQILTLKLGAAARGAFPRIYKLATKWIPLASYERCRLIGAIITEYGAGILSGAGAAKIIKKLKRLKRMSNGTADIDTSSSRSSPDAGRTKSAEPEQRRSSGADTDRSNDGDRPPSESDTDRPGGREPHRIYSARELIRRAEETGPMHNFPQSFDEYVFAGKKTVVKDDYVQYERRGSITLPGKEKTLPSGEVVREPPRVIEGTYEIGVRPSASGKVEVIVHRFFRPD